jgi:hypothetical protein
VTLKPASSQWRLAILFDSSVPGETRIGDQFRKVMGSAEHVGYVIDKGRLNEVTFETLSSANKQQDSIKQVMNLRTRSYYKRYKPR